MTAQAPPAAPDWLDAIEQSQSLCAQQRWDEVAQLCQQAIATLEPGAATAYRLLGWAQQEQGHLAEAEILYGKAIAIQPNFAETHARLGSLHAAQARWPQAIACYQAAIDRDAEFVGAYLKLGEACQQQGDLKQAAIWFAQAFQRQPDRFTPIEHWHLGNTLAQHNQIEAAIAAFRLAIAQDRHLLPAWISLVDLLRQQGHLEAAIACCESAIGLHPDHAALHTQLGNLLAKDQPVTAVSLHQRAIALCGWQQNGRYQFTYDWFTHNLPHWWTLLQPYAHQPRLQFLEVGSFEGMATCWLLDHILTHPSARLTTIDPAYQPVFDHNLAQTQSVEKVNKLTGSSHDLLLTLPAAFDVIYIDGCHLAKHVEQDALLAWPLLKAGGLLIFDDYLWSDPQFPLDDPRLGIDAFLESIASQFERVHQMYQLVIRKC